MVDGIGEVGVGKGEMDDSRTNCSGGRLHVLMYWLFQRVGCLELGPLYRQVLLISMFEFLW